MSTTQAIRDALTARSKTTPYGIAFTGDGWTAFDEACSPEAITALLAELDAARADTARIDWLADKSQNIANVELPNACVYANLSSLRGAIDMARSMHEAKGGAA